MSVLLRTALVAVLVAAFAFSALQFLGSINTFVINYNNTSKTVSILSSDINAALARADIDMNSYKIESALKNRDKTYISLLKTFNVSVVAGNKTLSVAACETDTVEKILNCAGFKVDKYDMVEPAPSSVVTEGTYIDYINVDYITGSYTQAVPFSVQTVYSDKLNAGVKKMTSAGEDGVEQVNYTEKIVNGEVVETTVDSKVTLLAAKDAVQTVGTRRAAVSTGSSSSTISVLSPSSPIALDANGNPVNYKKHVTVQATAYTYTGHNCATGVAPKPGYIAVNPRIIPYGTKMYIKSSDGRYVYGYAIAADTGGFINSRPTNVDLFFPTLASCNQFGRRNVEIYFLD